jgi:uncharacterized protein
MKSQKTFSRRDFLKFSGTTTMSLALSACNTLDSSHPKVTIPATEQLDVYAPDINQDYRIFVALPDSYSKNPDMRYPVVYVLDGNALFGMATETARIFNMLKTIRDIIIVGIGYPVDTFLATAGFRTRDMSPTKVNGWYESVFKPYHLGAPEGAGTGGAYNFIQFIREKLMPLIDKTYRTIPGDNGILGHSFGGLFGLYALFSQPDTFNRYIIGSAAIEWDNYMLLALAKEFITPTLENPINVFISVGGNEDSGTVSDMQRLVEILQEIHSDKLKLTAYIFEGEIHESVIPAHISRGLRMVFS